jgi:aldehyde:ferredoxin oxidoreductase
LISPGKIARVNLSKQTITLTNSDEYYRWLGGRGFGTKTLFSETSKADHPLSDANKLIFATGSLTGTSLPGASRTSLVTKNVLNNGVSYSSGGGNFGVQLRNAGFNALIIEGAATEPVYIEVSDDQIELRSAHHLWGKTTWDTVDHIRKTNGDCLTEVASIGPAGENLVKISCVIIDRGHALAWGGSGAVMGFKNLKAIAVKSSKNKLDLYDSTGLKKAADRCLWILKSSAASHALKESGTHGMAGVGGWSGLVPTSVNNLQEEYWDPTKSKNINAAAYKPYIRGRVNCHNCPLYCLHLYEMEREGEVLRCEGMHANSVRGFGSNWGVDDPYAVLKAHAMCNMFGLDVDGVSSVIAWALESFEKGFLSISDTGGRRLSWGDYEVLLPLIEDTAYRRGFGDILAEGVYRAALHFNDDCTEPAINFKKIGINEQGLRSHKAWAFGMAVSSRGGGHLSGSPQTENRQLPENVSKWLFGIDGAGNPTSYEGKGKLVAWYEIYKALIDSMGLCYFTAGWYEVALADINNLADSFNALLGVKISIEELWLQGEQIINMEKAYNTVHAGFRRSDDALPERIIEVPLTEGPYKGEYFDSVKFQNMLNEYYASFGWDKETGLQLQNILKEKGFFEVACFLNIHGLGK